MTSSESRDVDAVFPGCFHHSPGPHRPEVVFQQSDQKCPARTCFECCINVNRHFVVPQMQWNVLRAIPHPILLVRWSRIITYVVLATGI